MDEVFRSNIFKTSLVLFTRYCTFCFFVLSIFIFSSVVQAATIHVPADHSTIQAAIDAASGGDTVLVANGTYTGEGNKNLDFKGKAITVKSENGPESTIIDCENSGRGFVFHSGEGNDSILSGFTITKGYGDSHGGGIRIGSSSNPTIENFIIKDSSASMFGGGIQISSSSPILSDCTIRNNNSGLWGGGMSIHADSSGPSNPTIHNCKIINNFADSMGGGIYNVNSSTDIINSVISNNSVTSGGSTSGGGGIYFIDDAWGRSSTITNSIIANNYANYGGGIRIRSIISNLTIANSTIAYNSASIAGGGIYAANRYDTFTKITNSIIWGNAPEEIFVDSYSSNLDITYSSISSGWPGEGNIDLYPIFVDHAKDDFHLSNFSPCLNAGKVEGVPNNDLDGNPRPSPNGSNPDMGAYENGLATPEIPTPGDILNIFGIEVGNNWMYEGTSQGEPYSVEWEVTTIDQSTFPVPTYIYKYKKNGVYAGGWEWYENAGSQMKLWRTTGEYGGNPITISLTQGLIVAWDTMSVSDHVYSTSNTNISGLIFNVSMTVDVISTESITLNFDTVEAFKVQYQFHLWGNGINTTETFIRWIVPYLGTVKEQRTGLLLELNSFAIGGGNVSEPGDQDKDGLSDYEEFNKYNSHWLIKDSDNDGLDDGIEIEYWGIAWNEDPDGDLLINFLDPDSDNDGLSDGVEVILLGTNPALIDTDGDGLSDAEEFQCGSDGSDPKRKCSRGLPWLILLFD